MENEQEKKTAKKPDPVIETARSGREIKVEADPKAKGVVVETVTGGRFKSPGRVPLVTVTRHAAGTVRKINRL